MATGRTTARWARVYADGYDLSGHVRTIGPLGWEFEAPVAAALSDECQAVLPGAGILSIESLNAFLDNTATTGLHTLASGAGVGRVLLIPIGIRAAPAQGDPAFIGEFEQVGYMVTPEIGEYAVVDIPFGNCPATAGHLAYKKPWGTLLHAAGAETAVNSAVGVDDNGAATTAGGYLCWQILAVAGTGTVTIKAQDAATNVDGSFGDLAGATSGAIAHTSVPAAGIVALSTGATVRRYLRWQIVLSGITSVTFALAFVRG